MGAMTGLAQLERQSLSSTLTRLGPDAPTLCEGWRSRDLAAHIVLRERRPDAVAGAFLPSLAQHTQRVQDTYAEGSWAGLVDLVREGPPGWSPSRVPAVDDAVNLLEFYVHHEDLLRAVWGPGYGREHHYLRVFANQIRRKIEPDPAAPRHLINEPGLGYRLQA